MKKIDETRWSAADELAEALLLLRRLKSAAEMLVESGVAYDKHPVVLVSRRPFDELKRALRDWEQ